MSQRTLINKLELATTPLSNFDFNLLKDDDALKNQLSDSSLYVISQRPELSFENMPIIGTANPSMHFEIKQNGNPETLICELPLFENGFNLSPSNEIQIKVGSNDPEHIFNRELVTNFHGFQIYEMVSGILKFRVWFTPEKFLLEWSRGKFNANVKGDFRNLLKYNVHYVGKSTEQEVWKRLTGHSTLQKVLSIEYPAISGRLPTHEVAILFFRFQDNLSFQTFDEASTEKEMADALLGKNFPDQRTIYLDAEKALVNALKPKHNTIRFKQYPKSKDGLDGSHIDSWLYTLSDPITLCYNEGEIEGGIDFMGGDSLLVQYTDGLTVIKHEQ